MDLFSSHEENMNKLPFDFPQTDGYSSRWDADLNGFIIHIPNGVIFYSKAYFNKKISDRSVEYFLENDTVDIKNYVAWRHLDKEQLSNIKFKNINWRHEQINMYGKSVFLPRYSAWYGDMGKSYSYSGLSLQPIRLLSLNHQLITLMKVKRFKNFSEMQGAKLNWLNSLPTLGKKKFFVVLKKKP